ncbi:uncharacterized protein HMPREF1541_03907 [Cyphellophora europaea CBS 101466]|uniref:Uncharacterized protein n=1 Tax=Cyphellophora europaea (strain CBS 101466) TaxID=1220924 RepID=W2S1P8_CYPE1|nr:uncharacterized protein HMPREF1541_03907 [Cyphellophora europaea CBS 101466]ETN41968.1 hypothetical protein HMPREF1541_03907 [Cyphellophora europaea CBS 101466]
MSDTFDRAAFERQLGTSRATPVISPTQDSDTIYHFKRTLGKSGLKGEDFVVDPFQHYHILDWIQAVKKDNDGVSHDEDDGVLSETPGTPHEAAEQTTNNLDFFSQSPVDQYGRLVNVPTAAPNTGIDTDPGPSHFDNRPSDDADDEAESSSDLEPFSDRFVPTGQPIPVPCTLFLSPSEELAPSGEEGGDETQEEDESDVENVQNGEHYIREIVIIHGTDSEPDDDSTHYIREITPPRRSNIELDDVLGLMDEDDYSDLPDYEDFGAQVDFNHQEPAYEYAVEPVVPPPGPYEIYQVPPHTPIALRRLEKHQTMLSSAEKNYQSVNNVVTTVPELITTRANSKKRSASEARTPRSAVEAAKRSRLDCIEASRLLDQLDDHIENELSRLNSPVPSVESDLTPCTPNFAAYPGQFTAITSDYLGTRGIGQSYYVYGDPTGANANGMYANSAFSKAPRNGSIDLAARFAAGDRLTRREQGMLTNLELKSDLASAAHVAAQRSGEQAFKRVQVHYEAAIARLNGVAVGQHRYEKGHMTVEEYVEAGVCVCWAPCACVAFCGRFPDMMCPCNEHIVLDDE